MSPKEKRFLFYVGFIMLLLFILSIIILPTAYFWTQTNRDLMSRKTNATEHNLTTEGTEASTEEGVESGFRKGQRVIQTNLTRVQLEPKYKNEDILIKKAAIALRCPAPPDIENSENFHPVREWNGRHQEGTILTDYCYWNSTFIYQKLACVNKKWIYILKPDVKANCECLDPPVSAIDYPRVWNGNAKIGGEVQYFCGSSGRLRLKMKCSEERSWKITLRQECACQQDFETPFKMKRDRDMFEAIGDAAHIFITCNSLPLSTRFYAFDCVDLKPEYVPFREIKMDWTEIKRYEKKQNYFCACSNSPKFIKNFLHTLVFYYCLDRSKEAYVKLAICTSSKQWAATEKDSMALIEKINKYCGIKKCPELRLPDLPLGIIWDTTADPSFPGSVNKYVCTLNSTTQIYQTATCSKNGQWIFKKLSRVCECLADPPTAQPSLIRIWEKKSHNLGTVVKYRCPGDSPETAIAYTYTCSNSLKWQYTKLEECGCATAPPMPTKPIIMEWDGSRKYGTLVKYYCYEGWTASIMQKAQCNPNGNWYLKYEGTWNEVYQKNCICWDNPPLASFPNLRLWDEGSRRVGTNVSYLCFNHPKSIVKYVYECSAKRKWKKTDIDECVCTVPPPSPPYGLDQIWNKSLSIGTVATYHCTNAGEKSSPVQTATCSETDGVWTMMKQVSFADLLQLHCSCEGDPPSPEKHVIRMWNNTSRHFGDVANYKCPNEEISYRFRCNINKKWKKEHLMKCNLSGCREPPPLPPAGTFYKWPKHDLSFGTTIDYYCKEVSEAFAKPIQTAVCMKNERAWKLQNETSWATILKSECECTSDPPLVNGLFRIWNKSRGIGVISKYACPNGFIFYEYICTGTRNWEKNIIPDKCHAAACTALPPLEDGLISKFHKVAVSSIVKITYHCQGTRSTTIAIQTAVCDNNSTGEWSMMYNTSWSEIVKNNCMCLDDPLVQEKNLKQVWRGPSRRLFGSIVEYFCPTGLLRFEFICSAEKIWIKKEYSKCNPSDCSVDPPVPSEGTLLRWHPEIPNTVNYYCDVYLNSSEVIQSASCNTVKNQWDFDKKEPLTTIQEKECYCKSNPPTSELHLKLIWDSNQRKAGSIAEYRCPDDTLSHRYICAGLDKWTKIEINECSCLLDPPQATLPNVRSWDGVSRKIGSVVKYNCLQDPKFGVKYLYKCGFDQTWTRIEISSCMCDEKPPIFEERKPNYVSKYVGAAVYYQCTNDSEHGYSAIYRCGSERKWELEESFSCYCSGKPPSPSAKIVANSFKWSPTEGAFVGTRIFYTCKGHSTAPPVQTANCIRLPNSQKKGWVLSSPSSWKKLAEDYCVCKLAPPSPGSEMDWRWNNSPSPKVQYFCNNRSRTVVATAVCLNNTWELDLNGSSWETIIQEKCLCSMAPIVGVPSNLISWEGVPRSLESILSIWCFVDNRDLKEKYRCTEEKEWLNIFYDFDDCSPKPKCGVKSGDNVVCIQSQDEKQSHAEASMTCIKRKSRLLNIVDEQINTQLRQCVIDSTCNDYYISLTYNEKDSQWHHDTFIKLAQYSNWDVTAIQNPKPKDKKNCVIVDIITGKWKTVNCMEKHCFACQVIANSTDVNVCDNLEK